MQLVDYVGKFETGKVFKEWMIASANACVPDTALWVHENLGKIWNSKEDPSEKYSFVFVKCLVCVLLYASVIFRNQIIY